MMDACGAEMKIPTDYPVDEIRIILRDFIEIEVSGAYVGDLRNLRQTLHDEQSGEGLQIDSLKQIHLSEHLRSPETYRGRLFIDDGFGSRPHVSRRVLDGVDKGGSRFVVTLDYETHPGDGTLRYDDRAAERLLSAAVGEMRHGGDPVPDLLRALSEALPSKKSLLELLELEWAARTYGAQNVP